MPESDARRYLREKDRRQKQRRACSKTLLAIAGLTEQEMTDLIRAAGADPERISLESQDFPSWHLHMPLEQATNSNHSFIGWRAPMR